MDRYRQNYWSLYYKFITDFQSLTYKGYQLNLLTHFPSLIRGNQALWLQFKESTFNKKFSYLVTQESEIQQIYNHALTLKCKKQSKKDATRPIVKWQDQLIRLPKNMLEEYFPSKKIMTVYTTRYEGASVYLEDYLVKEPLDAINKVHHQLESIFKRYKHDPVYNEISFQHMLRKKLAFVIRQIEMTEHFIQTVNPSCVIISSPNHFGRIAAFVASRYAIPTISLQHGIIGNEFGFIPKVATIDALYGRWEVDWYVSKGAVPSSLAIIGHPRFDQANEKPSITKQQLYDRLHLNTERKSMLIIVRGERQVHKWKLFIDKLKANMNLNIIVRDYKATETHPLVKQYPSVKSSEDIGLYDLLLHVDIVVSYQSTVALEAMLTNKPTFMMQSPLPSYSGYYNKLQPLVQSNPTKLAELVIQFFQKKSFQKYCKKVQMDFLQQAYPDRSSSSKRLVQLIEQIIQG